jgi:hypothetical protein
VTLATDLQQVVRRLLLEKGRRRRVERARLGQTRGLALLLLTRRLLGLELLELLLLGQDLAVCHRDDAKQLLLLYLLRVRMARQLRSHAVQFERKLARL